MHDAELERRSVNLDVFERRHDVRVVTRPADEAEQPAAWEAFWRRRDPTPDTPRNEYQVEFFRRLRYAEQHFGARPGPRRRYVAVLGDAELDEGNVWEAVIDTSTRHLGNALWCIDLNRQSLDRVVPIIKAIELQKQFEASGWQVLEIGRAHV